jgi:type II secretory pathway pseudopilin PulG
MKKYLAGNAGFTLVELAIGMTLTIILMSAVFGLLSVSLTSSRIGIAKVEAQETARVAVDAMVREIRNDALDITVPATNTTSSTLSILIADDQDSTKRNTVTFYVASKTLYRKLDKWNGNSGTFPVTEGTVTDLLFKVEHPRTVKISVTVQTADDSIFSLETSVAGLNTQ